MGLMKIPHTVQLRKQFKISGKMRCFYSDLQYNANTCTVVCISSESKYLLRFI